MILTVLHWTVLVLPSSTLTAGMIHNPLLMSPKRRRAISSIFGVQCALDMRTRVAVAPRVSFAFLVSSLAIAIPEGTQVRTLFFGVNFGDVGLQCCSGLNLRNDLTHGLELWLGIPFAGHKASDILMAVALDRLGLFSPAVSTMI